MTKDIKIMDKFKDEENSESEAVEEEDGESESEEDEETSDAEEEENESPFSCGIIIRLLKNNAGLKIDKLEPRQGVDREPNDNDVFLMCNILLNRMSVGNTSIETAKIISRVMNRKSMSPSGRELLDKGVFN